MVEENERSLATVAVTAWLPSQNMTRTGNKQAIGDLPHRYLSISAKTEGDSKDQSIYQEYNNSLSFQPYVPDGWTQPQAAADSTGMPLIQCFVCDLPSSTC